jgi:hypothetical protein
VLAGCSGRHPRLTRLAGLMRARRAGGWRGCVPVEQVDPCGLVKVEVLYEAVEKDDLGGGSGFGVGVVSGLRLA